MTEAMQRGDLVMCLTANRVGGLIGGENHSKGIMSYSVLVFGDKTPHTFLPNQLEILKATNKKTIDIERQDGYAFVSQ